MENRQSNLVIFFGYGLLKLKVLIQSNISIKTSDLLFLREEKILLDFEHFDGQQTNKMHKIEKMYVETHS